MALPATDDFTNSGSDQALSARTNWTAGLNDLLNAAATDDVQADSSGDEQFCFWDADSFDADQYAQGVLNGTGTYIGLSVRGSVNNCYEAYVDGGDQYLAKIVGGSWTQLDTVSSTTSTNDVLYLEVDGIDGTEVIDFQVNAGSTMGDSADGSHDSGAAGVSGWSQGDTGRLDDWEGGNLTAADPAPSVTDNVTISDSPTVSVQEAANTMFINISKSADYIQVVTP